MTETPDTFDPSPYAYEGIPEYLTDKGFSPDAVNALLRLDVSIFRWRRMVEKGEFKGKILQDLPDQLEAALLQGLITIARAVAGVGVDAQKPTVGYVATHMALDPSRASRIVSDLVGRGYVIREASQKDARRTILDVTDQGWDLLRAFMQSKWTILANVFEEWTEEEVEIFSRLFQRYIVALSRELGVSPVGD